MLDPVTQALQTVDEVHADESAATRRQLVAGAGAALGSLGLLGLVDDASASSKHCRKRRRNVGNNTPQNIFNVAAKFEALATVLNTLGSERGLGGDEVTKANIAAAAREELLHYRVLVRDFHAKPRVKRIWIPNKNLANRTALLNTTQVGDGIFINAYLIATTAFGELGHGREARIMSEFMGVEAVHRAVARQSLGLLGNDRAFIRYTQKETAAGQPDLGKPGFTDINEAITRLQANGIGFDAQGASPGAFYDVAAVAARTPNPPAVNTRNVR